MKNYLNFSILHATLCTTKQNRFFNNQINTIQKYTNRNNRGECKGKV